MRMEAFKSRILSLEMGCCSSTFGFATLNLLEYEELKKNSTSIGNQRGPLVHLP